MAGMCGVKDVAIYEHLVDPVSKVKNNHPYFRVISGSQNSSDLLVQTYVLKKGTSVIFTDQYIGDGMKGVYRHISEYDVDFEVRFSKGLQDMERYLKGVNSEDVKGTGGRVMIEFANGKGDVFAKKIPVIDISMYPDPIKMILASFRKEYISSLEAISKGR